MTNPRYSPADLAGPQSNRRTIKYSKNRWRLTLPLAFSIMLIGCPEFPSVPNIFNIEKLIGGETSKWPITPVTYSAGKVILHAPGKVFSYHGYNCAAARPPGLARIQTALELPTNTTSPT